MIEKYSIRTDLALEQKERFESDHVEIQGVVLEEDYDEEREIRITRVRIETENGAKAMGKPVGTYITMEAPEMAVPDEEYHREISVELAKFLAGFLKCDKEDLSVLVVGLGNRKVTPDALGPLVVDNLLITGHLGEVSFFEKMRSSMAVSPGVMAQTGMETREILQGIIGRTKPEALVVIDALAAKTAERLNRTVQISDAGIAPGAGVGNERREISEKIMGIPVIAIGVPTVVDSATLAADILEESGAEKVDEDRLRGEHEAFMVTTRDIDQQVRDLSKVVGYGINWALQDLEIEEMNALLS